MASVTMYTCDFQGCDRPLDERDVGQVHLCVHPAEIADEEQVETFGLDLCSEHLDVVLARILASNTSTT